MKKRNQILLLVLVLGLPMTAIQAQDTPQNKSPFLLTTSQTDERLNTAFAKQRQSQPHAPLDDPGPVWEGLTDTTAFNERMNKLIYRADLKIERLKKHLKGQRIIKPIENKALQYLYAEQELENARLLARTALNAHPEKTFRDVAQRWESTMSERLGQLNADFEVYFYLAEIDLSDASPELQYVVDKKLTDFERNGVILGKEKGERIAELKSKITTFGNRFERNIFTADTTVTIHIDSLSGLPKKWIDNHSRDEEGFVRIPLTYPNMGRLAINAERKYTRQAAVKGFFTKSDPQNFSIMDSLRTARHQLAGLLGYESWAHYATEPMMAKSPNRIQKFLSTIDSISKKPIQEEINQLLQIQKETHPTVQQVNWVDWRYLQNKIQERDYNFSMSKMREYLPYKRVRDGMFTTTERLFDVDIRSAPDLPVWSSAVEPYELWDNGKLIGRIYLDVYPRNGKFSHAGEFPLRRGNNTIPETTLLVNLPGSPNDPGLLSPGQLTTFFHEFGHALHSLFRGNNSIVATVEQDFIEAPSQLFEKWAQDPENLSNFARHYETGEPIPNKLVKAYIRSDQFGRALFVHSRLFPAVLSFQHFNSAPQEQSIKEVEDQMFESVFQYKRPDWFHPSSFLPHLFIYSSNYYTYLWSKVIGRDLLTGFNQDNLFDPEVGRRYRKTILERSGTAPMEELIEEFLGRPYNTDAWQAWINGDKSEMANTNNTER